jgi:hypothetical protein
MSFFSRNLAASPKLVLTPIKVLTLQCACFIGHDLSRRPTLTSLALPRPPSTGASRLLNAKEKAGAVSIHTSRTFNTFLYRIVRLGNSNLDDHTGTVTNRINLNKISIVYRLLSCPTVTFSPINVTVSHPRLAGWAISRRCRLGAGLDSKP